MTVRVFGPLAVQDHDKVFTAFPTRFSAELVGFLAVCGVPVPRDTVARSLWPEEQLSVARTRLSTTLSALRRAMAAAGMDLDRLIVSDKRLLALGEAVTNEWKLYWTTARGQVSGTLEALHIHRSPLLSGCRGAWVRQARFDAMSAYLTLVNEAKCSAVQEERWTEAKAYEASAQVVLELARAEGFEPPTPSSEDWCSIH